MFSNQISEEQLSESLRQVIESGERFVARLKLMPKQEARPKPEYSVPEAIRRRLDEADKEIEKELQEIDENVKTFKFQNKEERDDYVAKLLDVGDNIYDRRYSKWVVYLRYSRKPFQG